MTASLRCDAPTCGNFVTRPEEADRWWRLERQGGLDIEEPRRRGDSPTLPPIALHTGGVEVHIGDDAGDELGDDLDAEAAAAEALEEADLPIPVLHFCSAGCLADWSAVAAATESVPDTGG